MGWGCWAFLNCPPYSHYNYPPPATAEIALLCIKIGIARRMEGLFADWLSTMAPRRVGDMAPTLPTETRFANRSRQRMPLRNFQVIRKCGANIPGKPRSAARTDKWATQSADKSGRSQMPPGRRKRRSEKKSPGTTCHRRQLDARIRVQDVTFLARWCSLTSSGERANDSVLV